MSNNISSIQDRCYGCRSCEQTCPKHCITMNPSEEGFLYPAIDEENCIHCGLCLKGCPAEQGKLHRNYPKRVFAFKNKNFEEIMNSASGGAADVATKVVLGLNGVVYGAAYDDDFMVKHIEVDNEADKIKLQSSKYVQSDTNNCYSRVRAMLDGGRKVLFTGTPCQIAGLYAFLGGDDPNLYTLDLICHGVPSPKFFAKYLEYQKEKMNGDIIYYNFRSKDKRGWGTQYLIKTKTKTKTNAMSLDKYGNHFLKGDCYRESCYKCPYSSIERVGDITTGDFWGVLKSYPNFYSSKGVSSVFVNSTKGEALFSECKKLGDFLEISFEDALLKQGNLKNPTVKPVNRSLFFDKIDSTDFVKEMHIGLQIKNRIKNILPQNLIIAIKRAF